MHNSRNSSAGWVWSGYLKSGRNFQSDAAKSVKSTSVYRKSAGTLYNLTGKNYTQFTGAHKLSTNVTYAQSKQMSVYKYGIKYIYAYVKGADGTKGWIWHGSLTNGRDYQMTAPKTLTKANYVMAKAGTIYQLGSNRNLIAFNQPVSLSADKTYVATQSTTVYKKGTAYSYYYVTSTDGTQSGWVWHSYLKKVTPAATKVGQTTKKGTANGITQYATKGDVLDSYDYHDFKLVTPSGSFTTNISKSQYKQSPNYASTSTFQTKANVMSVTKSYGNSYKLKSSIFLPVTYNKSGDLANPQSATFSKDNQELFVAYAKSGSANGDSQQGFVVRYDIVKLRNLLKNDMSALRYATYHHSVDKVSATDQAILDCMHVGPTFTSGHMQGLALNPKTNELWFVNKTKAGASAVERLDQETLKPNAEVSFSLKSTVTMNSNLAFDNEGNAYTWSQTASAWPTAPVGSIKIYKGTISTSQVHFSLIMQVLKKGPGLQTQGTGFNAADGRLYLVSDDSIFSVPTAKLGKLTKSDINEINFSGNREFEGMIFDNHGNGFVLANSGAELLGQVK